MNLADTLDPARIALVDHPVVAREDILRLVARLLCTPELGPELGVEAVYEALLQRERVASTAVGDGVAFPHVKLEGLEAARTAVVVLRGGGAALGALDGRPTRIVVALIVPPDSVGGHLMLLGVLSRKLRDPVVRAGLLEAPDPAAVIGLIGELHVVSP
ncbi:MAG: PTS sugar transporter subunit IIA [Deltaproteobacteria bacterium]|nr:PTS sugar transporter subunit IIA [Deltaproteobacteria bacterium]